MKIKVSNLGPIQGPVEFDLKPFTILIGPNNAGKTWLAYTVAGIFSYHNILTYIKGNELENVSKNYVALTKAIDELLTTAQQKLTFASSQMSIAKRILTVLHLMHLSGYPNSWVLNESPFRI